jgi:hypothetical protein
MAQLRKQWFDNRLLSERLGLEPVAGHVASKSIGPSIGSQDVFERVDVYLFPKSGYGVVNGFEKLYFGFGFDGRLEGFLYELGL